MHLNSFETTKHTNTKLGTINYPLGECHNEFDDSMMMLQLKKIFQKSHFLMLESHFELK